MHLFQIRSFKNWNPQFLCRIEKVPNIFKILKGRKSSTIRNNHTARRRLNYLQEIAASNNRKWENRRWDWLFKSKISKAYFWNGGWVNLVKSIAKYNPTSETKSKIFFRWVIRQIPCCNHSHHLPQPAGRIVSSQCCNTMSQLFKNAAIWSIITRHWFWRNMVKLRWLVKRVSIIQASSAFLEAKSMSLRLLPWSASICNIPSAINQRLTKKY